MVEFRKITEENFKQIVDMRLPPEPRCVAPNVVSLAQAWLYYENHDVYPFAIYHGDDVVGFMMLDEDLEEKCMTVWRFMIAPEQQGKGYGQAAMEHIIDLVRKSGKYTHMTLDVVPGNERAMRLYKKLGFAETGEISEGEIVMKLAL